MKKFMLLFAFMSFGLLGFSQAQVSDFHKPCPKGKELRKDPGDHFHSCKDKPEPKDKGNAKIEPTPTPTPPPTKKD